MAKRQKLAAAELADFLEGAAAQREFLDQGLLGRVLWAVSLDKPNEAGNMPEYADERTDGPTLIEQRDSIRRLHAAIDRLPEVEQDLIKAVYFEGRLLRDVGAQRGRSRQAVQQRLADITTRLRHSMGASC